MEKKKMTNAQLEKRLRNAVLHIDRTKDTKQVFFDDRGLRVVVNEDWACIGCGNYTITFRVITPSGISTQYTFLKRFLDVALANESRYTIKDAKGNPFRSYALFIKTLEKEHADGNDPENDYLWLWYVDKWIFNYECQLASLGESPAQSFATYEQYMHNAACSHVFLSEKTEDMTNHQYVANVIAKLQQYMEGVSENIIFAAQTDDEKAQAEIAALNEQQTEKTMEEQANGDNK